MNKLLTCQEVELLLPATAAGALDADEEPPVKEHLAICPPCVKHLHDFQATVELLAYSVPQVPPPEALRHKVLHAVALTPPTAASPAARRSFPQRPGQPDPAARLAVVPVHGWAQTYRRIAPSALAACLLLLLGAGIWMGVMVQRMAFMQERLAQQQTVRDLLNTPGAAMADLKPPAGPQTAPAGTILMAPGNNKIAIMTHLPPPVAGHTYQVWLLSNDKTPPLSAGSLPVDDSGGALTVVSAPPDPRHLAGVRITSEATGGAPAPGSTNVLEGWWH